MTDPRPLLPRASDPSMRDGLQARLHDPLWLLGRQWQFEELTATDGGSPAVVDVTVDCAPLSRYRPGAGQAGDLDLRSDVLDAVVEAEAPARPGARSLAARVAAGRHAVRTLVQFGAPRSARLVRLAYALQRDSAPVPPRAADGEPLLAALAGRALDGDRLHAALAEARAAGLQLPMEPPLPPDEVPAATAALEHWLAWEGLEQPAGGAASPAWQADRMEYAFSVSARLSDGEHVLHAPEHIGGSIDWPSFDRGSGTLEAHTTAAPATSRVIATPVTYRGMPMDRLWAFEDAQVNLAGIQAGENDVARLVVVWFALVYSDDWFLVPVDLPCGSLARVTDLQVTDTFHRQVPVPHASKVDGPLAPWRMFAPTGEDDVIVVAPTVADGLRSEAVEEVLLTRDEMANMAWAIEQVVEGESGARVDRYGRNLAENRDTGGGAPRAPTGDDLHFRLGHPPPAHWLPLVPTDDTGVTLRVGTLPLGVVGPASREPWGQILASAALVVREEEVPKEGVIVRRRHRHARAADGSHHTWISRSKGPASGGASSGLRFDSAEESHT